MTTPSSAPAANSEKPPGRVLGIFIAPKKGEPMVRLPEARAVAGKGLEGDRYYDGSGTFSAKVTPKHEISLVESEAIEALERDSGLEYDPILSRRNILTRGVALNHYMNREFSVGEVVVRGLELCEPCGHMEKLSGVKGARLGLVHRGGLRCQILQGGILREGDVIVERTAQADFEITGPGSSPVGAPAAAKREFPAASPAGSPGLLSLQEMQFALVPAGEFVLGSEKDPLAWDEESPQQIQTLADPYWISRFPVSNAQYREFIDAGGYQEASFWPEAIEAGVWKGGLLEHKADERVQSGARSYGAPFDTPAHPVSGVGWYEGLAFARWLEKHWTESGALDAGWAVRMPSEIEWEKAARGGREIPDAFVRARAREIRLEHPYRLAANPLPKRRFPWGDEAEASRANFLDSGVGATSPVGQFPLGASPYGVEDLSGNVWEWTRSLWGPYPYPTDPQERAVRERPLPNALRTLKGGGFNYRVPLIRCSVRHCHSPMMRYRHIGFRVVICRRTG